MIRNEFLQTSVTRDPKFIWTNLSALFVPHFINEIGRVDI